MFYVLKNRRGQGPLIEYAVLFFIIIAAVTAMSTYVKRAVQARVRGARNYMWYQVNGTYKSIYPNRTLPLGYEPYYVKTDSERDEYSVTMDQQTPWTNHEGKFETDISSTVTTRTISNVAPAINAN